MNRAAGVLLATLACSCARSVPPDAPKTPAGPHVTVTSEVVLLDGEVVAPVKDLVHLTRLDVLFTRLKARASDPKGMSEVWFDLDASATSPAAASAIATAAFAGFRDAHVRAGQSEMALVYSLPWEDNPAESTRLSLAPHDGTVGVAWQSALACDRTPADDTVPPAALGSYLDGACRGAHDCLQEAQVQVDRAAPLADVLAAIRAASAHADPATFTFNFSGGVSKKRSCGGELPPRYGLLAPEKIQRLVREKFGVFRVCYESGLARNAKLEGRVVVKFVIERDGAVSGAKNEGSDLPDSQVVDCIVNGFGNLKFPAPDGGVVTVVYPIMFKPGD